MNITKFSSYVFRQGYRASKLGVFSRQCQNKNLFVQNARSLYVGTCHFQNDVATSSGNFTVSVEDGLRIITINRPKKYNALLAEMFTELTSLLDEAAADDNTVLTAVTGVGDFFTAGNDLSNFKDMAKPGAIEEFIKRVELLCAAHINFNKAIVAVINGPAVGYGVTSLAFYDAVFSTDKATFHAPFTALGQCPEMCSSYTFPRLMGRANAAQLLMFNEKISAAKGKELGLVTKVFPHETFQQDVWPIVKDMAKVPPISLKYSKGLLVDDEREIMHKVNVTECTGLIKLAKTDECRNAILNFFRRKK